MASGPMKRQDVVAFPASKVMPFLRAMADPEGKGDLSPRDAAILRQVETNLADYERRDDG